MASIRQHGNKWQARISRKGFKPQIKSFHTKQDAEKWARHIEIQMDKGSFVDTVDSARTTLADLIKRYLSEVTPTMRGASVDIYKLNALIRNPVSGYNLLALTPTKIAEFRDQRLKKVSNGTVIRDLCYISSVIRHAQREWGFQISNPVSLIKKPSPPQGRTRVLTRDEEVQLLNATKPSKNRNIYTRPFIILALETAMRRGELLSLRWDNVDLIKRTAFLPITKNGSSRFVPLSSRAIQVLQELPRSLDGRVLPIHFAALENNFRRAIKRAGLQSVIIHTLRHTAISRMAERLPNVIELSAVSGHKSLASLKNYYHIKPEALAEKLG